MNDLYLLLGSNLGDRCSAITNAKDLISKEISMIEVSSRLYETEPWGNSNQDKFLNQVVKLQSSEDPEALLEKVLSIEQRLGRKRNNEQNSARIIDIDILFYNKMIHTSDILEIPHPRIQFRRFVLVPLFEIAPDMLHPVLNKSIGQLLRSCPDKLKVRIFNSCVNSL